MKTVDASGGIKREPSGVECDGDLVRKKRVCSEDFTAEEAGVVVGPTGSGASTPSAGSSSSSGSASTTGLRELDQAYVDDISDQVLKEMGYDSKTTDPDMEGHVKSIVQHVYRIMRKEKYKINLLSLLAEAAPVSEVPVEGGFLNTFATVALASPSRFRRLGSGTSGSSNSDESSNGSIPAVDLENDNNNRSNPRRGPFFQLHPKVNTIENVEPKTAFPVPAPPMHSTLASSSSSSTSSATTKSKKKANSTTKRSVSRWTAAQDRALSEAVKKHNEQNWKAIAALVEGRDHVQCLQRWQKALRPGLVKGHWTREEDDLLRDLVSSQGTSNWGNIAAQIPGRIAKQCRERWTLNLDPSINRSPFTPEEDELLLRLHQRLGSRWAEIKRHFEGRTENSVKTRFKSLKRAKAKNCKVPQKAATGKK